MDNCPKCGFTVKEGQKFCKKCGILLDSEHKLAPKENAKKSVFEDKLKNEPLNVEILHVYSRFLFKNLLFKEAISILLKILAMNEKDGVAKELLFKSYLKLNMLAEALDAGLQILEEKPDDILLLEDLAEISLKQEKYENALKYLNSILNISPKNTGVLKKKSEALLQMNKLEEAIISLKKLHEIDKTDITAILYIGIAKALNSNFDQALKILLPLSSNIENDRDKSRAILYIAYSMSQLNMNIEEIEEWVSKINLPVLQKLNHSLDKNTLVESFLSVVQKKLSNIKSINNIKFTLDALINNYLNPLQDFITEKTKSKFAEVLFEISTKQFDLKLYPESLISCNEAFNYFPSNDKYKEKCEEIKKLLKLKMHKKKRNIIKTIVMAATMIFIVIISVVFINYNKQEKEWIIAKNENTPTSYQNYIIRYPEGRFLNEAIELKEDAFWEDTLKDNSIEAFNVYIISYPKGKYIKEARAGTKVTDYDGNVYNTVIIGSQVWMTGNLKVTHYRNGDQIQNVTDDTKWTKLKTGAWCYYKNESANNVPFGKLYNWYAINDSRHLCPPGWHIPSSEEWQTLIDFLGGNKVAGFKMKTISYWNKQFRDYRYSDNQSRFSALPGGYRRYDDGGFIGAKLEANYWSSTNADYYLLGWSHSSVNLYSISGKSVGHSVRCIRD